MRDPRPGRFIAVPALPLTSRAADMLASSNEGRDAGRKGRYPLWGCIACGLMIDTILHLVIGAVAP